MNKRNLLIVLLAACSGACQKTPHRIGMWIGATGGNLAKMLESEINYQGGVDQRRLQVRVVSQRAVATDQLTPQVLTASLDSLGKDSSVLALITRMTDSTTEQATKTFEAHGLPYLITTPVPADYTRTHPHAFLLVPTVEQQAQFLVDQALRAKAPRRVALMYVREPHGELLAQAISAELTKRHVKPEFVTSFSQQADELNMTAKAREIVQNKPTALLFVGRSPSLMIVHGTIRNGLPDIRILASDLFDSFHVYLNPQSVYTGIRFVRYADPAATDSVTSRLRDRVTMWVGRNELNNESMLAYDAAHALASAIKEGGTTRAALTEKLRSLNYPGVAGPIRFGTEQRIQRVLYLAEVQNNGVVNIARSDSAAGVVAGASRKAAQAQ